MDETTNDKQTKAQSRGYRTALDTVKQKLDDIIANTPPEVIGDEAAFRNGYLTAHRVMEASMKRVTANMGKRNLLTGPKAKVLIGKKG